MHCEAPTPTQLEVLGAFMHGREARIVVLQTDGKTLWAGLTPIARRRDDGSIELLHADSEEEPSVRKHRMALGRVMCLCEGA